MYSSKFIPFDVYRYLMGCSGLPTRLLLLCQHLSRNVFRRIHTTIFCQHQQCRPRGNVTKSCIELTPRVYNTLLPQSQLYIRFLTNCTSFDHFIVNDVKNCYSLCQNLYKGISHNWTIFIKLSCTK